jgi:homocysteine S-methyltransferase
MSGADRTVKICNELGVAGLLGLLPLRSERHAEFMHNEVPGVEIPDWLRKKIADAPDDASALAIGVEEASNLARAVKSGVQGIYLMPPFGSAKIAAAVMQALN